MVGNGAADLNWGRCGREWVDISTGEGVVDYGAVDVYR